MALPRISDPFQFLTPLSVDDLRCRFEICRRQTRRKRREEFVGYRDTMLNEDPRQKTFLAHFSSWALKVVCQRHRDLIRARDEKTEFFCEKITLLASQLKEGLIAKLAEDATSGARNLVEESTICTTLSSSVSEKVRAAYLLEIRDHRSLTLDVELPPNPGPRICSMTKCIEKDLSVNERMNGKIYIMFGQSLRTDAPPLIKVGSTQNDGHERMSSISRTCKFPGSSTQVWKQSTLPSPYALRVEKLIHTELLHYGHGVLLRCYGKHGRNPITHQEFFEAPAKLVQETFEYWIAWANTFKPYDKEGKFRVLTEMEAKVLYPKFGNGFLLNSREIPWRGDIPDYTVPQGECACDNKSQCLRRKTSARWRSKRTRASCHEFTAISENTTPYIQNILRTASRGVSDNASSDDDDDEDTPGRKHRRISELSPGSSDTSPLMVSDSEEESDQHRLHMSSAMSVNSSPAFSSLIPASSSTRESVNSTTDRRREPSSSDIRPSQSVFDRGETFVCDYMDDDAFDKLISTWSQRLSEAS